MAAALAAFLSVGSTWATVDGPYAHHPYRGTEVDGGPLVALATLVGLVACIAGAVIILRRGSARSVGVASAVSAGACVFGVIGALLALGDVGQARDQASTSFGPAELTDAEVTTGPGLWTALSLTSLGVVTGICGWIAMRRLDQE